MLCWSLLHLCWLLIRNLKLVQDFPRPEDLVGVLMTTNLGLWQLSAVLDSNSFSRLRSQWLPCGSGLWHHWHHSQNGGSQKKTIRVFQNFQTLQLLAADCRCNLEWSAYWCPTLWLQIWLKAHPAAVKAVKAGWQLGQQLSEKTHAFFFSAKNALGPCNSLECMATNTLIVKLPARWNASCISRLQARLLPSVCKTFDIWMYGSWGFATDCGNRAGED